MNTGRSLVNRILDKVVANDLPREQPVKTSSGYGQGNPCDACGEPILNAQVEYQIALGNRLFRLHLGCYALWTAEVHRRRWVATARPSESRSSRARLVAFRPMPDTRRSAAPAPLARIRNKLTANLLPKTRPGSATRRKGDGQPCSGCDTPIDPVHIQYDMDFGGGQIIRLHADCERGWRRETGNERHTAPARSQPDEVGPRASPGAGPRPTRRRGSPDR